jgi:hypothetical protein
MIVLLEEVPVSVKPRALWQRVLQWIWVLCCTFGLLMCGLMYWELRVPVFVEASKDRYVASEHVVLSSEFWNSSHSLAVYQEEDIWNTDKHRPLAWARPEAGKPAIVLLPPGRYVARLSGDGDEEAGSWHHDSETFVVDPG